MLPTPNVIITCAVTGGHELGDSPAPNPVTPAEIAAECLAAAKAGAAIVHIHVRDPATRRGSTKFALYEEVVNRVRDANPEVLINLTSGVGARYRPGEPDPLARHPMTTLMSPEARVEHIVRLRPELSSLDVATFQFGAHAFINLDDHCTRMAEFVQDAGVKCELEVYDSGQLRLARHLCETGVIRGKPLFQLCLGIRWGAEASPRMVMTLADMLPPDAVWAAFGISRFSFPMVAQAVLLGGHVRVGLEDNIYLARGALAPGNAALVARAGEIIHSLGSAVASPAEARAILGIGTGTWI